MSTTGNQNNLMALLNKGVDNSTMADSYATQSKAQAIRELLDPAKQEIADKEMEILSLKQSITLETDLNKGKSAKDYKEIHSAGKKIVVLTAEIAFLKEQYEVLEKAFKSFYGSAE